MLLRCCAHSVALAAFGLDSLLEIGASTIVPWELSSIGGATRQARGLRLLSGAFLALGGAAGPKRPEPVAPAAGGSLAAGHGLAAAVLLRLALTRGLGWWWADAADGLVLTGFPVAGPAARCAA